MSFTRCRFVSFLLGLILLAWVCTDVTQAQERGRMGGRGGYGGAGAQSVAFLHRQDVQDELALLDDQKKQLTALQEKIQESFRGLTVGTNLVDAGRKINEETKASIDNILSPQQQKRFQQLVIQNRIRTAGGLRGGFGGGAATFFPASQQGGRGGVGLAAAITGDTAQQLGVSDELQAKLRVKGIELEQEVAKEVAKRAAEVRFQLLDQLLADLTPEQRTKFKEMIGAPFTFKDEPSQFGGRGGDGRGEQGFGGGGARGGGRRGGRGD